MTGLKDCKSCQENVSHSLAKRKLVEKLNGSFLINQVSSWMLPYTSQIAKEVSFFFFNLFLIYYFYFIFNINIQWAQNTITQNKL